MALGGGTFKLQNKTLPGAYINFASVGSASMSLSDRGVVTFPMQLNWGPTGVTEIAAADFAKSCRELTGYSISDDAVRPLREIFQHARLLYLYRLNGEGNKATSALCTAKYAGTRGNDIYYSVTANVDSGFDVKVYLDDLEVDSQTVTEAAKLEDNSYVTFKKTDVTLEATAKTPLTGGTNSTVSGDSYAAYFDAVEGYAFNIMGIDSTDSTVKALAVAFCKRMREDFGKKFQVVLYNQDADYEGVINVANTVRDEGAIASALVYWVSGAEAGCGMYESLINYTYDGEYNINMTLTQAQLERVSKQGLFVFHNVNGKSNILYDQNSLTTLSDEKNYLFQDNKIIRICDQIGNDIAALFGDKYLGKIPNDASGRVSLWNDIVDMLNQLQALRAIQDFSSEDVTVEQGEEKNAVLVNVGITVTGTMAKLYMIVHVA